MNIIHTVLGKANPDRMNGVNKVAFQLAKTQHEMGHEAVVWGIANSLEHNYPPRNFRTELFQQLPNKIRLDAALVEAVHSVSEQAVFHLHGSFIPEFYHLSKLLRRRGIGYVYTPHGALTEAAMSQGRWRKKIYFTLFEQNLIAKAKAVQLLGEQEVRFLDTLMDVPHKVLIPNGMDLSELPNLPKAEKQKHLVFSFCGRLDTHHKGLDFMLNGFHQFLQKRNSAHLEIIGDGADRAALESLAAGLGNSENVTFHGAKYGDEKYRLMARGNVFLHTSRNEGFPMAVLEAAALGIPCLTSEPTNINSFIRQYGAGFPLGDELNARTVCEAMGKSMEAYRSGALPGMGARAKNMIKEAFDWRKICGQLVEVYGAEAWSEAQFPAPSHHAQI